MTVTANDERRVRQHLQLNATSDGGGAISKVTLRWASPSILESNRWSKPRDAF
jgi:hypothetical protein